MVYKVGISTGFWYIGKDPALLGLATKIGGLGATAGVQFVQVDLETISEFYEPEVAKQVKKMMTKLGITDVGLHGEIAEIMSPDCAEKRIWDQTHLRLVQALKYAADFGFKYVNIHFSARPIISLGAEAQQRVMGYMYPVVDPWGRPLQNLINGNSATMHEAMRHIDRRTGHIFNTDAFEEELEKYVEEKIKQRLPGAVEEKYQEELRRYPPDLPERERRMLREQIQKNVEIELRRFLPREAQDDPQFVIKVWLKLSDTDFEKYTLSDGEFGAFAIVAHWMKERNDYLWNNIAKGANPDNLYYDDEQAYCAAVASKYIEGHVTLKANAANKKYLNGMSIKEWCESKKLYLLFENPEANKGAEGAYRLFHPQHYFHTIKNINSPFVKICLDVEHTVSHSIDLDTELPKLPNDFGKYVLLWHLGQAVPYGGTAHIPINRGSPAQEQIYKWMYWIRKKGWKDGYILFERGGGRSGSGRQNLEVFEDSVLALRQISKFLDMDIEPKKLPPEFFGISMNNEGVYRRQVTIIKDHAWDPLEGLLSVPEEKHTFFGKTAVEKGKAQEWEKRKLR